MNPLRFLSMSVALCAICLSIQSANAAENHLFGQTIVKPAKSSDALGTATKDAAETLTKVTGQPFTVTDQSAVQAIVLRLNAPTTAPTTAASFSVPSESFTIRSSGAGQLVISSDSEGGLVEGLYFYLDQLGCRWFYPGDNWTILPSKQDITLKIDRTVTPAFISRIAAATGGYPANPLDPKMEVKTKWELWRTRNGFGGPVRFAGHSGEAFMTNHRKELEAHPEYFAMVGGKRQGWSVITKLCVSNPDAVKLYVDDRLAFMRKFGSYAVSVEPSDGTGYCECPQCSKIGINDQPYYLANQVAKAVAKEFSGRWVSLYAYATHANVPKIDLEPNVYVMAVPYGLQRTGLSGDELVQAWSKKVSHFGVYDYWSIPDWNHELPWFNWVQRPAQQIRFWRDNHVESIALQSTNGAGTEALPEYIAIRLMWDPSRDEKAIIDDFFKQCFGPAELPMRRMLTRWANDFLLTAHELGLSYVDLEEATRLASDNPAIAARIEDYAKYLQYVRLCAEAVPGNSPEAVDTRRKLITWAWRINQTCMVHSSRMADWTYFQWLPSATLRDEFDRKNPGAAGWVEAAKPVTSEEIRALTADGMSKYKPVPFETRQFSGELLAPAPRKSASTAPTTAPTTHYGPLFMTSGNATFEFQAPDDLRELKIKIGVARGGLDLADATDPVVLTDAGGKIVFSASIPINTPLHEMSIPIPAPGRYTLSINDLKRGLSLNLPADFPLVMRGFISIAPSPPLYFYVPKGLKKVVFYLPSPGVIFRDSTGKIVSPEPAGLTVLPVAPGQDGQIWSMQGYKAWFGLRAMNTPYVFSFSPETLMYPKDLAVEVAERLKP